jgi:hypothetical protein
MGRPPKFDPRTPKQIWADEEKLKRIEAEKIKTAQAPHLWDDGETAAKTAEARESWDNLKAVAAVKFPNHLAAKFNIDRRMKLAAVAVILGWPLSKIALAAGVTTNSVQTWLAKEEVKEFSEAFAFHLGQKDTKEFVTKTQFSAVMVLKDIMENAENSASTRADIAKWFYIQQHGMPKETREITGLNVRDLTEQLSRMKKDVSVLVDVDPTSGKPYTTN